MRHRTARDSLLALAAFVLSILFAPGPEHQPGADAHIGPGQRQGVGQAQTISIDHKVATPHGEGPAPRNPETTAGGH